MTILDVEKAAQILRDYHQAATEADEGGTEHVYEADWVRTLNAAARIDLNEPEIENLVADAIRRLAPDGVYVPLSQRYAGRYPSSNLIVSAGSPATQTVPHFHVHLVPRRPGDGLHLPWTGQP